MVRRFEKLDVETKLKLSTGLEERLKSRQQTKRIKTMTRVVKFSLWMMSWTALFVVTRTYEEDVPDYMIPSHYLYTETETESTTLLPYIDPSTPSNVTVIKGKTAMLACVVRNVGKAAVSWMRLRDINVMAMNEVTNTKDKRIRAIHVPESDRWALRIESTTLLDEGGYECQVTTTNKTIKIVYLKVLDPQTEILGPSEVFLSKGSTLNLTCIISNGPASQPFIIWTHNSKMLKYVGPEGGYLTSNVTTSTASNVVLTQIVIYDTDVTHSGIYQCEPGAAPTTKVNVHVLDGKLPAAMQTAGVQVRLHLSLLVVVILHSVGGFCRNL